MVKDTDESLIRKIEAWQLLVHMCHRWRHLVFGSRRRLNLRLFCEPRAPIGDKLDIWPASPLLIQGAISPSVVDNILTVLERHNHVSMIDLNYLQTTPEVEKVWGAMQVPFPELTVFATLFDSSATLVE